MAGNLKQVSSAETIAESKSRELEMANRRDVMSGNIVYTGVIEGGCKLIARADIMMTFKT
jgi:hypothetical protein